ncbi:probable methyltransferase pmt22 [Phtheirospermum japonicum]|uniref:Methyltransferase n=1 Tax=Phtheirospermum japonicum TaxID=374723 RepID=A0A830D4B3_9LAMI|nr:probable methyltransferase pmt22 [Phtheirospermum japonicum]
MATINYPFTLTFFLLLVFVTFVLIATNITQPAPFSSGPEILHNGISSSIQSAITNISSSADNDTVDDNAYDDNQAVAVEWELCAGPVAVDYIPCLDNQKAIKALLSRESMQHRERHCPDPGPICLVPLPQGYKVPVPWPKSRDMIWYNNAPHPMLVEYKKDQRWVMKSDDYFVFPGGGTQFINGVNYYIESIGKMLPMIEWGKKIRVVLDVGCGVASFGGALLDRDVITMSFAPKDEHKAQIQFALERGIPATLLVIGSQKLPFPDNSYDLIHCARCRVHWHDDGGKPLMELNRILRPGGYFVWSATPVYRKDEKHQNAWKSMVALSESMCWSIAAKTYIEAYRVGLVIFQKPISSSCYQNRKENKPPLCDQSSRPNNLWYVPLVSCLVPLPGESYEWPSTWPKRLSDKPLSLFVEPDAEETFKQDTGHWSVLVSEVYLGGLGLNWSNVRNVMDMSAGYGGFAAALINQPVWVMNVVPIHEPDTLSVIFDRGMIGIYHDWCESFNTYPRSYDLLHSSYLFGNLTKRCDIIEVAAEMDRMLRPGGYLIVQDTMEILNRITPILRSLHWSLSVHKHQFLVGKKKFWRPDMKTGV